MTTKPTRKKKGDRGAHSAIGDIRWTLRTLSRAGLVFAAFASGAVGCGDDEERTDLPDGGTCPSRPTWHGPCQGSLVCESTCGALGWQGRIECKNGLWEGIASPCETRDRFPDAGDGSIAADASKLQTDASGMDAD